MWQALFRSVLLVLLDGFQGDLAGKFASLPSRLVRFGMAESLLRWLLVEPEDELRKLPLDVYGGEFEGGDNGRSRPRAEVGDESSRLLDRAVRIEKANPLCSRARICSLVIRTLHAWQQGAPTVAAAEEVLAHSALGAGAAASSSAAAASPAASAASLTPTDIHSWLRAQLATNASELAAAHVAASFDRLECDRRWDQVPAGLGPLLQDPSASPLLLLARPPLHRPRYSDPATLLEHCILLWEDDGGLLAPHAEVLAGLAARLRPDTCSKELALLISVATHSRQMRECDARWRLLEAMLAAASRADVPCSVAGLWTPDDAFRGRPGGKEHARQQAPAEAHKPCTLHAGRARAFELVLRHASWARWGLAQVGGHLLHDEAALRGWLQLSCGLPKDWPLREEGAAATCALEASAPLSIEGVNAAVERWRLEFSRTTPLRGALLSPSLLSADVAGLVVQFFQPAPAPVLVAAPQKAQPRAGAEGAHGHDDDNEEEEAEQEEEED